MTYQAIKRCVYGSYRRLNRIVNFSDMMNFLVRRHSIGVTHEILRIERVRGDRTGRRIVPRMLIN